MAPIDLPLQGSEGVLRLVPWAGQEVHEGGRYLYRLLDTGSNLAWIEPRELFQSQPDDPNVGDFSPQQCVGELRVIVGFDDGREASTKIEVLPTKLEYETEFRAMLEQIADHAAEAVLQGFAPSSFDAHVDATADAATRYRSLAFLAARFRDEAFLSALERIRHRPHREWAHRSEQRPLGAGLRAGAAMARSLHRGSRARTPEHLSHLPLDALPLSIEQGRQEATYDTLPNRFVRYAVGRWQGIALEVLGDLALDGRAGAGPTGRGRREAQWLVDRCEDLLAHPAMREAGRLDLIPAGNQVLLRQPGYRDVLRAFALTEASLALEAVLPDDMFSATQRNVATLYEYWCFVALAECVSAVAGGEPQGLLFERSANGLSLVLKQGEPSKLSWELEVEGRMLVIDLWFNRTFTRTDDPAADMGSWARRLRPDASLRLRPKSARPTDSVDPELDVWLHFDAKYRIERMTLDEAIEGDEPTVAPDRTARREDLLKMHAYRDAIRRSAGAYVLYPGTGPEAISCEFHELLPGLGAFPLRPVPGGEVAGAGALQAFVREVARHVSNQASAMERTQFWTAHYNRGRGQRTRPVDFLARPPADTLALVGYVRAEQVRWVMRTKQYNVRVGDRRGSVGLADQLLSAELLVLWTRSTGGELEILGSFERVGPWQVAMADELEATGYPMRDPLHRYLVTPIEPLPVATEALVNPVPIEIHPNAESGAPWATAWATLTSQIASV